MQCSRTHQDRDKVTCVHPQTCELDSTRHHSTFQQKTHLCSSFERPTLNYCHSPASVYDNVQHTEWLMSFLEQPQLFVLQASMGAYSCQSGSKVSNYARITDTHNSAPCLVSTGINQPLFEQTKRTCVPRRWPQRCPACPHTPSHHTQVWVLTQQALLC